MKVINPRCPECGGPMHDGILADATQGGYTQPMWVEGAPERSIFLEGQNSIMPGKIFFLTGMIFL